MPPRIEARDVQQRGRFPVGTQLAGHARLQRCDRCRSVERAAHGFAAQAVRAERRQHDGVRSRLQRDAVVKIVRLAGLAIHGAFADARERHDRARDVQLDARAFDRRDFDRIRVRAAVGRRDERRRQPIRSREGEVREIAAFGSRTRRVLRERAAVRCERERERERPRERLHRRRHRGFTANSTSLINPPSKGPCTSRIGLRGSL